MSERRDTSAPGQALEFEIWSELIKQSRRPLHVFLPLLDRGLDAYTPVEAGGALRVAQLIEPLIKRGDSGRKAN